MFRSTSCWSLMTTMGTPIPVMTTWLCIADMLYQIVIMTSLRDKLQNNYLFLLFSRNKNMCVRIIQKQLPLHWLQISLKKSNYKCLGHHAIGACVFVEWQSAAAERKLCVCWTSNWNSEATDSGVNPPKVWLKWPVSLVQMFSNYSKNHYIKSSSAAKIVSVELANTKHVLFNVCQVLSQRERGVMYARSHFMPWCISP